MPTDIGMGGIGRHALDLSAWLRARGHQVLLAATPAEWDYEDAFDGHLFIPTRFVGVDGGSIFNRLYSAARSVITLRRWLRRSHINVIHAHESAPGLVAHVARLGLRIPMVITYHGSEPARIKSFGTIARFADLVVTPSHRAADDLANIAGVPREKLHVIGLGIKPPPLDNKRDVAALRKELLRGGDRLIVTLARVAYQKGIDVLIECVASLKSTHPGYRFVVVGDGPLDAEMRALAAKRGIADQLQFYGRTEVPYRFLRAADLMLLTSRWEALPISIAEALQTGTPVVATDCSGVHELVDNTVGACVPVEDVPAICSAVTHVLDNNDLRQTMAKNALKRSKADRFKPDAMNGKIESLYLDLAARK